MLQNKVTEQTTPTPKPNTTYLSYTQGVSELTLHNMYRRVYEDEVAKNVIIPFNSADCRNFLSFYSKGSLFKIANPDVTLPNKHRRQHILFFGPTAHGRASFINSAVTAYSNNRDVQSPLEIDTASHSHKDPNTPFVLSAAEIGENIVLTKIMGATWVDPVYDIQTLMRATLGKLYAVSDYDEAQGMFLPDVTHLPVDLVVFTLSYNANQRELDYMRILLERLDALGIPCAVMFTNTDRASAAQAAAPAASFRPPAGVKIFKIKSYAKDKKNSDEEMNKNLLNDLVRLVMEADLLQLKGLSPEEKKRQEFFIKKEQGRRHKPPYTEEILRLIPEAVIKLAADDFDLYQLLEAFLLTDRLSPLESFLLTEKSPEALPEELQKSISLRPALFKDLLGEEQFEALFPTSGTSEKEPPINPSTLQPIKLPTGSKAWQKKERPMGSLASQALRQFLQDEFFNKLGKLTPAMLAYIHIFQNKPRLLEMLRSKTPLPVLSKARIMSALNVESFCRIDWASNSKKELNTLTKSTLIDMITNEFTGYRPGYFFDTLSPNMKRREPSTTNLAFLGPPGCDKEKFISTLNQLCEGEGVVDTFSSPGAPIRGNRTSLTPFLKLLDVVEFFGSEISPLAWSPVNLDQFVETLKYLFMGCFPNLPRVDLFVFLLPSQATKEEVILARQLLHQFKYLGIPIGLAITKLEEANMEMLNASDADKAKFEQIRPFGDVAGRKVDTLDTRPLLYGKGVQLLANLHQESKMPDACATQVLRAIMHFLLAAEMGLGVDVTATSLSQANERILNEMAFREDREFQDCLDFDSESEPEPTVVVDPSAPQLPRRRERPQVEQAAPQPAIPPVPRAPQLSFAQLAGRSATQLAQVGVAEADDSHEPIYTMVDQTPPLRDPSFFNARGVRPTGADAGPERPAIRGPRNGAT